MEVFYLPLVKLIHFMLLTQEKVCDGRHDEATDSGSTNGHSDNSRTLTHLYPFHHFQKIKVVKTYNFKSGFNPRKKRALCTRWRGRVSSRSSTRRRKPTAVEGKPFNCPYLRFRTNHHWENSSVNSTRLVKKTCPRLRDPTSWSLAAGGEFT